MATDGYVQLKEYGQPGKRQDHAVTGTGDSAIYRLRVESYPANSFGDLTADAWGVPKVSLPHSLSHGMWTFDVPAAHWFVYENGTQVYTSTDITSTGGAAKLLTTAAKHTLLLEGRECPRYQANRGHLFSTAVICPSKTADGVREWGIGTDRNRVVFRLKSDGKLYAVLRSAGVQTYELEIDTSGVAGFDVERGNVYDIQFQWRGVGNYVFFINLVECHAIENLGTLTDLSIEDPAMPMRFAAQRVTADVSMTIGCGDISSENGADDTLVPQTSYANITLNGTNLPVMTIHNPLLINSRPNTRTIYPQRISVTCDKKAVFKVWQHRDPGLLTGETLVAIENGSFVQTDSPDTVAGAVVATAATVASMRLVTVLNVQANGSAEWTINDPRIHYDLVRGDYLTITATTTVGLVDAVIAWGEAV
jgi:hypothetical protein